MSVKPTQLTLPTIGADRDGWKARHAAYRDAWIAEREAQHLALKRRAEQAR